MSSQPAAPVGRRPRCGARLGRGTVLLLLVSLAAYWSAVSWAPAFGYFAGGGAGVGGAVTGTLLAPSTPAAAAAVSGGTVSLTWTGSTLGTGQAAQGYFVQRIRTSDQLATGACETSAAALIDTTSCSDLAVPDGAYRYQVVAVSGSWTATSLPSDSVTVVSDVALPTVTVTSTSPAPNANGWVRTSPVGVTVGATPGGAGTPITSVTTWVDAGSRTTVPGSAATAAATGEGLHTVSFYATDALLRQSATGSYTVRIDTVAPAAPSAPKLTAASDTGASATDGITRATAPALTGTAEAGTTVTLYDGSTPIGTGTATGGTWTITSSPLAAATHTITARTTDLAGNTSTTSAAASVVIDTAAPASPSTPALATASDTGRSATDKITRTTTPTFTGAAETAATVALYDGAVVVGSTTAASGTWSAATTVLADGSHTLTAKATDVAGNTSAASAGTTLTIDTLAPTPPSRPTLTTTSDTGSSATDGITRTTTPTFTGTTEKKSLLTLLDNGTSLVVSSAVNSGTYNVTSPALTNGSHPLAAIATDVAGNVSAPGATGTVVIDTVAPTTTAPALTAASDTGISSTDRITRLTTLTVTGVTEAGSTVVLLDGSTQVAAGTATGGTFTLTATNLAAGSHTFTVKGTDLAGNAGAASGLTSITIDATAPAVTLNQAVGQPDPAASAPVAFTATFSEAVFGLTGSDVTLTGTAGATSTTLVGSGPTYTLTVGGMTGPGTVTALLGPGQVTDTAGNPNTASTSTDNTITYNGP